MVTSWWKVQLFQKLTSRRFWAACATALFIILTEGLGLNIPNDVYWKLIALVLGYIFGESAVDIARARNPYKENAENVN